MKFKSFASMNIAIVGNDPLLSSLTQRLALSGHQVFIGMPEGSSSSVHFLTKEFENVFLVTIEDAAAGADAIVLATTPQKIREAAYLLEDVRNKVIIDISFLNYNTSEVYLNTIGAVAAITGSPYIVKGFYAAETAALNTCCGRQGPTLFLAGDSKKAKEVAKYIGRDLGFQLFQDFGGADSAPLLDEMAMSHYHTTNKTSSRRKKVLTIRVDRRR